MFSGLRLCSKSTARDRSPKVLSPRLLLRQLVWLGILNSGRGSRRQYTEQRLRGMWSRDLRRVERPLLIRRTNGLHSSTERRGTAGFCVRASQALSFWSSSQRQLWAGTSRRSGRYERHHDKRKHDNDGWRTVTEMIAIESANLAS